MNIWSTIYRFAWITLGVLLLIAILCMFVPQYRLYREYQRREAELKEQIRHEEELLATLRRNQERFRSDPLFVKHLANEKGLALEHETLYRFVSDGTAGTTSP